MQIWSAENGTPRKVLLHHGQDTLFYNAFKEYSFVTINTGIDLCTPLQMICAMFPYHYRLLHIRGILFPHQCGSSVQSALPPYRTPAAYRKMICFIWILFLNSGITQIPEKPCFGLLQNSVNRLVIQTQIGSAISIFRSPPVPNRHHLLTRTQQLIHSAYTEMHPPSIHLNCY